jgi:hypothetical protein
MIGKNFLKDTKALFQEEDVEGRILWEAVSEPHKDFLQQNHAICNVPAYKDESIQRPVECKVSVVSGGKQSEPHRFTYLPNVTPANYSVSNCSCARSTQSQSPRSNQSPAEQSLTCGQQQIEPVEIQGGVNLMTSGNESIVQQSPISNETSGIQLCPPMNAVPLEGQLTLNGASSVMEPLPNLSFDSNMNMIPTTTQERQVVNELRCILEQSVPANTQKPELISPNNNNNIMDIKPEMQFPVINLDHGMNGNEAMSSESGVPLDLQFPPQVTATTTATESAFPEHTRIHTMNPFQSNSSDMNCSSVAD